MWTGALLIPSCGRVVQVGVAATKGCTARVAAVDELWPQPMTDIDIGDAVRSLDRSTSGRLWVAMVMITTLDGAAEIDGLSGGLGAPADKAMFGAMRALADVIIVAGGTARAENYGPPARRAEAVAARTAHGQSERPQIAVVSGSLSFDPGDRLFEDPEFRPLIYTSASAPPERIALLEPHAELAVLNAVTPAAIAADLAARGHRVAVLEGGPSLNGQFLDAGLIDECNISIAPLLVGGDAMRIVRNREPGGAQTLSRFELRSLWTGDGIVFANYQRGPDQRL